MGLEPVHAPLLFTHCNSNNAQPESCALRFGAGNGTRTRDLLITNELLYRLSYTSIQHGKNLNSFRDHFIFIIHQEFVKVIVTVNTAFVFRNPEASSHRLHYAMPQTGNALNGSIFSLSSCL